MQPEHFPPPAAPSGHPPRLLRVGVERAAGKKRSNSKEKHSAESVRPLAVMDFSSATHGMICLPALLLATVFIIGSCPPATAHSACNLVSSRWEIGIHALLPARNFNTGCKISAATPSWGHLPAPTCCHLRDDSSWMMRWGCQDAWPRGGSWRAHRWLLKAALPNLRAVDVSPALGPRGYTPVW